MLLPSSKRVTLQPPLFFGYCIAKNQNKPGKKQSFENFNNQAIFTMDCGHLKGHSVSQAVLHLEDEKGFQMKQLMICVFSKAILIQNICSNCE
jgi:hypothetical protein